MACWLLGLSIGAGAGVVGFSLRQAHELAVRAPVDPRPFARAAVGCFEQRDWRGLQALCDGLPGSWAAELARAGMDAVRAGERLEFAIEEATARARMRADRHLYAIRVLGRLAVPLALGSAIVELGIGFQPLDSARASVAAAEHALDCALRLFATGITTTVLCQICVGSLQRQAHSRLRELHVVAAALMSWLQRTAR